MEIQHFPLNTSLGNGSNGVITTIIKNRCIIPLSKPSIFQNPLYFDGKLQTESSLLFSPKREDGTPAVPSSQSNTSHTLMAKERARVLDRRSLLPFYRLFNFGHQFAWPHVQRPCNLPNGFKIRLLCAIFNH